jgi:hypothetical protein
MSRMLRFNKKYFTLAVLIFITEVCIAVFVHDKFIRPYFGDVLVVILIYCVVESFLGMRVMTAALSVLLFSFCVETLQYFHFINVLGLEKCTIARIVIGTSFSWIDILTYIAGIFIVLIVENIVSQHFNHK